MAVWLVLTTAPDKKTARRLARQLVEKRLAACVNIDDGVTSVYRWKGKVETAKESLLTIKTSGARLNKVLEFIRSAHPYQLPEAMAIPVNKGSKKYLGWIEDSLK